MSLCSIYSAFSFAWDSYSVIYKGKNSTPECVEEMWQCCSLPVCKVLFALQSCGRSFYCYFPLVIPLSVNVQPKLLQLRINKYEVLKFFRFCKGYAFTVRPSEKDEKKIRSGLNNLQWMVCCYSYSVENSKRSGMCESEKMTQRNAKSPCSL